MMSDEQLVGVIGLYRSALRDTYKSKPVPDNEHPSDSFAAIGHVGNMFDRMEPMLAEGKREKVMRWLGFVQGVLWVTNVFTLGELKGHNR